MTVEPWIDPATAGPRSGAAPARQRAETAGATGDLTDPRLALTAAEASPPAASAEVIGAAPDAEAARPGRPAPARWTSRLARWRRLNRSFMAAVYPFKKLSFH